MHNIKFTTGMPIVRNLYFFSLCDVVAEVYFIGSFAFFILYALILFDYGALSSK